MTTDKATTASPQSIEQNSIEDQICPLTLYGPEVSYFTGKLESAIRYMKLPYQRIPKAPVGLVARATGIAQVPGLELADGRWLTDSTPIIAWFDQRFPEFEVIPNQPVLGFFSRLLEDYADEWLWRPAMHFRWDYEESAEYMTRVLVQEAARHVPLPFALKRRLISSRQRTLFTIGDGVTAETWDHVEKILHDTLDQLKTILETRLFLLGNRPSLVDFSYFGPVSRHFARDPASARIVQQKAPIVLEWIERVWHTRAASSPGELCDHLPDDWAPTLDAIGSAYLPYLCANAEAWKAGKDQFEVEVDGVIYREIRTAPYRVWCLEEIRRHFKELSEPHRMEVRTRLEAHDCWDPLWQIEDLTSGIDPDRKAPFVGNGSMTGISHAAANRRYWRRVAPIKRNTAAALVQRAEDDAAYGPSLDR